MKNKKEEKGNVLKASLAIEDFGMKYAKHHFNASNSTVRMVKQNEGLSKCFKFCFIVFDLALGQEFISLSLKKVT